MKILIISMFSYALRVKEKEIASKYPQCKVATIFAFPDDIDRKLAGQQFDFCFADIYYSSKEIGKIREHIQGKGKIERF